MTVKTKPYGPSAFTASITIQMPEDVGRLSAHKAHRRLLNSLENIEHTAPQESLLVGHGLHGADALRVVAEKIHFNRAFQTLLQRPFL